MKTIRIIAFSITVIVGLACIPLITGCDKKPVEHCSSVCPHCGGFCVEPSGDAHKELKGQEAINAMAAGGSTLYHHCAAGHTW